MSSGAVAISRGIWLLSFMYCKRLRGIAFWCLTGGSSLENFRKRLVRVMSWTCCSSRRGSSRPAHLNACDTCPMVFLTYPEDRGFSGRECLLAWAKAAMNRLRSAMVKPSKKSFPTTPHCLRKSFQRHQDVDRWSCVPLVTASFSSIRILLTTRRR